MKKISVLIWNDFTHDKRVRNISKSLSENGYDVTVIAAKPYKGLPVSEKGKIRIRRIPQFSSLYSKQKSISSESKMKNMIQKNSIFRFIKNNKIRLYITAFLNWASFNLGLFFVGIFTKPDIIYANDLETLTVGYLISKICKAKLIFDSHELWLYGATFKDSTLIRQKYWEYIQKKLINKLDAVIVTTNYRAKILTEQYSINQINVIKNCSKFEEIENNDLLRDEFNIPKDRTIIFYQGLLAEKRGIFTIVDVLEGLENVSMVFMGMGKDIGNLKYYIHKKGLENKIFVKDAVPPDLLLKYTSSADIGLQLLKNTDLNHYSTISNKLLEYIMAGIAVLGSDFPEIREIIKKYTIGEVVDPDDKEEIQKKLTKMIIDKSLLEKYKRNTLLARQEFKWENEEKRLLQIINNLN